ncbi:unnamed protein product [Natator depressus]
MSFFFFFFFFFKDWKNLCGICTDAAASAMMGAWSGFQQKVKCASPNVIVTHCGIHRQVLAAKVPTCLNAVVDVFIQAMNYIKAYGLNTHLFQELCNEMGGVYEVLLFHTQVQWLSRAGVGKLWPAGQIWPLRALDPACRFATPVGPWAPHCSGKRLALHPCGPWGRGDRGLHAQLLPVDTSPAASIAREREPLPMGASGEVPIGSRSALRPLP